MSGVGLYMLLDLCSGMSGVGLYMLLDLWLLKYLDAEFTLMLKFTKFAAEFLFVYSCGNGFLQNLHDAVTLKVNSKISRITVSFSSLEDNEEKEDE